MDLKLVIYPDSALRETCTPVEQFDAQLHLWLDQMHEIMLLKNGIGLAANQVGLKKRIFIADVSPMFSEEYIQEYGAPGEADKKLIEFINPEITHRDGRITWNEGCLSLPEIFYDVNRAKNIIIKAQDRHGKSFSLEAQNILAVCCQHENDHLDGHVFLDHVSVSKRQAAVTKLKKYKKTHTGD